MKNHALKSIVLTMLSFLFLSVNAFGQYISPSLPDNLLDVGFGGPRHFNCTMLNYSYGGGTSTALLKAMVWLNPGLGSVGVHIDDNAGHSNTFTISNAAGADVIIGNVGTSTTQFRIAVSYISLSTNQIMYTIYNVSWPGTSFWSCSGAGSPTTIGSASGYSHIDVIAEAGNTSVNNLPYCDKFMISYVDPTTNDLHCYYSSLNSPGTSTDQIISTGSTGDYIDVAAIQRLGGSGTPDDVGLCAYADGSGMTYYREWDATAGTLSTPMLVDATHNLVYPRIDGVDDYNNNFSPLTMNWEIVAEDATAQIAEYNNLSGAITMLTSSSAPYSSGISGDAGVVAAPIATSVGSNDHFTVAYETGAGGPYLSPFAHYVDRTTGTASTYYKVNLVPANVWPVNCIGLACNTSKQIMICWDNQNPDSIMYKITDYSMSFKPGREQKGAISMKDVHLSPNPATNDLVVTGAYENGGNYTVTDITGKQVLRGSITSDKQHIDISRIAKGDYILNLHYGNNTQEEKFVKE